MMEFDGSLYIFICGVDLLTCFCKLFNKQFSHLSHDHHAILFLIGESYLAGKWQETKLFDLKT